MSPLQQWFDGFRQALHRLRPARAEKRWLVANPTRGTVLATGLVVADGSGKRSKGLLGRTNLSPGEGLWIVPCEAVHTFFMHFPIDLVYLDRHKRVRKVRRAVAPWRISVCILAHSVLELAEGTIDATQTRRGDRLEFSPAPSAKGSTVQNARD
jgi:hypothetical protein